jgi:hypothetical protein
MEGTNRGLTQKGTKFTPVGQSLPLGARLDYNYRINKNLHRTVFRTYVKNNGLAAICSTGAKLLPSPSELEMQQLNIAKSEVETN